MTDLEMTRLCAEAMGITGWLTEDDPMVTNEQGEFIEPYDPLHDDAQAMALVKKFALILEPDGLPAKEWAVHVWYTADIRWGVVTNKYLNRAIVECVAKMQAAKA
jgi:hypothetical protein